MSCCRQSLLPLQHWPSRSAICFSLIKSFTPLYSSPPPPSPSVLLSLFPSPSFTAFLLLPPPSLFFLPFPFLLYFSSFYLSFFVSLSSFSFSLFLITSLFFFLMLCFLCSLLFCWDLAKGVRQNIKTYPFKALGRNPRVLLAYPWVSGSHSLWWQPRNYLNQAKGPLPLAWIFELVLLGQPQ